MRVYLRRVQVLVAQDLLYGAHIHAVLDHQGRRRVPQLVGGVFAGVKPGLQDGLFHHSVYALAPHTLAAVGDEKGFLRAAHHLCAHRLISLDCSLTGFVEVNNALLAALAKNTEAVLAYIPNI